jgi:hypothetical protein
LRAFLKLENAFLTLIQGNECFVLNLGSLATTSSTSGCSLYATAGWVPSECFVIFITFSDVKLIMIVNARFVDLSKIEAMASLSGRLPS